MRGRSVMVCMQALLITAEASKYLYDEKPAAPASPPPIITSLSMFQNGTTSGFEMCFCYRIPAPLLCRGSQPKHVSNPDSVMKKFNPDLFCGWCGQATVALTSELQESLGDDETYVTWGVHVPAYVLYV